MVSTSGDRSARPVLASLGGVSGLEFAETGVAISAFVSLSMIVRKGEIFPHLLL